MQIRRSRVPAARVLVLALSFAALGAPSAVFAESSPAAPLAGVPSIVLTALPGTVSSPMQIVNAHDGSGRLFVVEQAGTIRIYKNGAFLPTPFLDIHTLVTCCGEQGLLSVAFHPDYASNGEFYVYYINKLADPGDITIARYSVSTADPDVANPASAQIVLVVPHPTNSNHNGGQLYFSPLDGYLYAGTGDGGGGGDGPNNAQNMGLMLGKILRIDVDGTGAIPCGQSAPAPYAIPASNPFVGAPGSCGEIWAYGVRNPWRFSFDRTTGDLLIGDVGQNLYEEIDFQPAASAGGENYGWRRMEGLHCYNPGSNCNDGTLTLPVLEHTHGAGWCAIIGGIRYRGAAIPALAGTYVYSDSCLGDMYGGTPAGGGSWTTTLLKATNFSVAGFGEDESGEVYVADLGGRIYRIDPSPNPSPSASSIAPASVIAADPGFVLTVNGSGFVDGSVVRWNGSDRPTTFVSGSRLTAAISSGDIAVAGTPSVTVFTPAPGGGTSAPQTVHINRAFLDVPTSHFADLYIQAVYNAGVTAGCGARNFCPDVPTTRAQMAVFILKAKHAPGYLPPSCTGTGFFKDVACLPTPAFAVDWIEQFYNEGITSGCGAGNYCPNNAVTRAQVAIFLLKGRNAPGYLPPSCTGTGLFKDVACSPTPAFAVDWIEQLSRDGITAGCGGGNYCPGSAVTRAQMAVFLAKAFGLPLP